MLVAIKASKVIPGNNLTACYDPSRNVPKFDKGTATFLSWIIPKFSGIVQHKAKGEVTKIRNISIPLNPAYFILILCILLVAAGKRIVINWMTELSPDKPQWTQRPKQV